VAESNAPDRPDHAKGIKGWVMKKVMGRAGDGRPELRTVFLSDLDSPFGMALVGDRFYVAVGSNSNVAENGMAAKAWGCPVGVALDRGSALLVADDVGNVVWRVTAR